MRFSNMIGQESVVTSLKNIIAGGQIRGSYLFLGPDGVGKRTAAIELSKAINCEDQGKDEGANCSSCGKIDSMNHPDVFVIYPEGASFVIKIGKVREIIYQASLKPYEAKNRVFIINDSECMTLEAQNALLKLLEEPPKNHILILTSSNSAGLLPTVISRCKTLKFRSLQKNYIEGFLKEHDTQDSEASLVSHMAMGSLGKALEFKEENIINRRDQVVNYFFLKKTALLREDVLTKDISEDIEGYLHMLLYWYRDLLVAKFTKDTNEFVNIDRSEEITGYSGKFSKERLEKCMMTIMSTIDYVRRNINPKIALFNMAVDLKRT